MTPAPAQRAALHIPVVAAIVAVLGLGGGFVSSLIAAGSVKGEFAQRVSVVEEAARGVSDLRTRMAVSEARATARDQEIDRRLASIEAKVDRLLGAAGVK